MTSDDENEETLAGEDYNSAIAADEEQNDDEQDHEAGLEDDVRQNLDAKWQNCFNRLLKFKAEHGHCLVRKYHVFVLVGLMGFTKSQEVRNATCLRFSRAFLLSLFQTSESIPC
jgi:hypothetical protein